MGTIKDLIDLTTQLANRVEDRKLASELNAIQTLISKLQTEQATMHETNIKLREERLLYIEKNQKLETEIKELKSKAITGPSDTPTCPHCSTTHKPYYMNPVPPIFFDIKNATHECPKCKYNTIIQK